MADATVGRTAPEGVPFADLQERRRTRIAKELERPRFLAFFRRRRKLDWRAQMEVGRETGVRC